MEVENHDEVIEVLPEPPEKVLILDSDGDEEDEDVVVRYVIIPENDQNPAESTSSQTELVLFKTKGNAYPKINKNTNLDYLPKGLVLPKLTDIKMPISMEVPQPDGTTTFLLQYSSTSTLWITNFDLQIKKCELCDMSMDLIGAYLQHRVLMHFFPANRQICVGCKKDFNTPDERRRHTLYCLDKANIDVTFCYICDTQLHDYLSYRQHLKLLHPHTKEVPTERKTAVCPICQKEVNLNYMSLSAHVRTHDNPKPYKCAHCPDSYSSKRLLLRHLTVIHFHELVKHICTECSPPRYFNETPVYLKHRQSVHGVLKLRPKRVVPIVRVTCPECSKLVSKNHLENHIRNYHKAKEELFVSNSGFPCDQCGRIYLNYRALTTHKKSHLPESQRPHKCQFCGKGFNSKSQMNEHERDHTGKKFFEYYFG